MPYIKVREKKELKLYFFRLFYPGIRVTYYYEVYACSEKRAEQIFDQFLRSWAPFKECKRVFEMKLKKRKPDCFVQGESLFSCGSRDHEIHVQIPIWRGTQI